MTPIQSLPPQSPLGQFIGQIREAHSPVPKQKAAEALKQDAVNLTLGASGGVLAFTAVKLAEGSFGALSHSSFILPAASGAVAGVLAHELSDHPVAKVALGAVTGATVGFALSRLGLASSQAILTGAIAGAGGSALSSLIPQE